jgi:hypothetical protein
MPWMYVCICYYNFMYAFNIIIYYVCMYAFISINITIIMCIDHEGVIEISYFVSLIYCYYSYYHMYIYTYIYIYIMYYYC